MCGLGKIVNCVHHAKGMKVEKREVWIHDGHQLYGSMILQLCTAVRRNSWRVNHAWKPTSLLPSWATTESAVSSTDHVTQGCGNVV